MLIVNLAGGVGNQLFQYSMGYNLSVKYNIPVVFSDTFDQYDYNFPKIKNIFHVEIEECNSQQLKKVMPPFFSSSFARRGLAKLIALSGRQLLPGIICDLYDGYTPIVISDVTRNYYFHGTWQSERYFGDFKKQVLDTLVFKQPRCLSEINSEHSEHQVNIGVQIRRGDYITNPKTKSKLGAQSLDYYVSYIEMLRAKFPESAIYVFSDDITWAKDHLSAVFNEIYFAEGKDFNAESDLQMLTQCHHFVLSNSTFGWWGAYLSNNKNSIVVTPSRWCADGTNMTGLIPAAWDKSKSDLEAQHRVECL